MKLGRFKFRVRQLASPSASGVQPELRLDESGGTQWGPCGMCSADESPERHQKVCRICLMEGPGDDDYLINPCQCKGSIESVHLGCLRHWIRGRLNIAEGSGGSYFYQSQACELCKTGYPTYVRLAPETREPLVELPQTAPPFIVLENMVRDSQQHTGRGLHVISLAENKLLKLGRGHESDVRIADVSISRCHATIRFHRGQFVLEDNHSKFGTLVAMKKPRMLEPDGAISIQVGRTVLSLKLQTYPDAGAAGMAPLLQSVPGSNPQDERALRLMLLTRSGREAEAAGPGGEQPDPARAPGSAEADGEPGEAQL